MARSIPELPKPDALAIDLPLIQEIESLPGLIHRLSDEVIKLIVSSLSGPSMSGIQRIYITGCGDSYHAGLSTALAFDQFSGATCQAITAMQMARYTTNYLSVDDPKSCLVIGVSSSGEVSRTIEALRLARKVGARTIAITSKADSPLGTEAEQVIAPAIPSITGVGISNPSLVVPGMRSYMASLISLYLLAIYLGWSGGHLENGERDRLQQEIRDLSQPQFQTLKGCKPSVEKLVQSWADAQHFEICGSGPNFGTAQFSVAKLLEASGDTAIAQDLEEWAHLQYFGRHTNTPTLFISAGGWDVDRAGEVIEAASRIGRRVAVIAPAESSLAEWAKYDVFLPTAGRTRECFSPVVTCIPGALLAAFRSEQIGETYFRSFSGGRDIEGGGGISRIRTSHQIDEIRR